MLWGVAVAMFGILSQAAAYLLHSGILWFVHGLPESQTTITTRLLASTSWGVLLTAAVGYNTIIMSIASGNLPTLACNFGFVIVVAMILYVHLNFNINMVLRYVVRASVGKMCSNTMLCSLIINRFVIKCHYTNPNIINDDIIFTSLNLGELLLTGFWSALLLFSDQYHTPYYHLCMGTKIECWMENLWPLQLMSVVTFLTHLVLYFLIKYQEKKATSQGHSLNPEVLQYYRMFFAN